MLDVRIIKHLILRIVINVVSSLLYNETSRALTGPNALTIEINGLFVSRSLDDGLECVVLFSVSSFFTYIGNKQVLGLQCFKRYCSAVERNT